jgi:hypothetical protein
MRVLCWRCIRDRTELGLVGGGSGSLASYVYPLCVCMMCFIRDISSGFALVEERARGVGIRKTWWVGDWGFR